MQFKKCAQDVNKKKKKKTSNELLVPRKLICHAWDNLYCAVMYKKIVFEMVAIFCCIFMQLDCTFIYLFILFCCCCLWWWWWWWWRGKAKCARDNIHEKRDRVSWFENLLEVSRQSIDKLLNLVQLFLVFFLNFFLHVNLFFNIHELVCKIWAIKIKKKKCMWFI